MVMHGRKESGCLMKSKILRCRNLPILLFVAASFSLCAFRFLYSSGFQTVGDLPGGDVLSDVGTISSDGSTVVGYSSSEIGLQAYRWTATGGIEPLGDLDGGDFQSSASAVSGDGSVVVGIGSSDAGPVAFRWTPVDGMVGLGLLAGGTYSLATSVSRDGRVVVGVADNAFGQGHAFRWTSESGMLDLAEIAGGYSVATAVSADGTTVTGNSQTEDGQWAVFLWKPSTGMIELPELRGSSPVAISGNGATVVGIARDSTAFRWNDTTGVISLGLLPGSSFAQACGVSDDGNTVVGGTNSDSFIWDPENGMRSLTAVLTDLGNDLSQIEIGIPTTCSANGHQFAGAGAYRPDFRTYSAWHASLAPNTPAGTAVSVRSAGFGSTISFDGVLNDGDTSVITAINTPALAANFEAGSGAFFEVSTTAAYSGAIVVKLPCSEMSDPRLLHLVSGTWVDVTAGHDANYVWGTVSSLSPFAVANRLYEVTVVSIDIKPGTYPNAINLGSNGDVPVAILSTPNFDARTVDPISVRLAGSAVRLRGNGTAMSAAQDVNGDGRPDLVVHVATQALQLSATDQQATLEGTTFAGRHILGSDTVRVIQQ
jgi:probable HAF family extracellular repeat protein